MIRPSISGSPRPRGRVVDGKPARIPGTLCHPTPGDVERHRRAHLPTPRNAALLTSSGINVFELSPGRRSHGASLLRVPLRLDLLPSAHDQTILVEKDWRFPKNCRKGGKLSGCLHLESVVSPVLQLDACKWSVAGGFPTDHVALDRSSSHVASVRCEPGSVNAPPKRSAARLQSPSSKSPCVGRRDRDVGDGG